MGRMIVTVALATTLVSPFREDAPPSSIAIPRGRPIVLNGIADSAEWNDAAEIRIQVAPDWDVRVRMKNDGDNLLFGFFDLRSGTVRVPEVLIDALNDKGGVWKTDDWWFHASAQDCASQGRFNDYSTCTPDARDWSATNVRGMTFPQVMEVRIPMRLLGVAAGATLGVAFNVTDTRTAWSFWPPAAQMATPATWAEATIER